MKSVVASLVGVAALLARATGVVAEITVEPPAGPPGTVVVVSGIDACSPPPGLPAQVVLERPEPGPDPVAPVTPPNPAELTVTDLPAGTYAVTTTCIGAGTVIGTFVVTAPAFTG